MIHFRITKVLARTGRTIVLALLIRLQYFIESKGSINVNNRTLQPISGFGYENKKERKKGIASS